MMKIEKSSGNIYADLGVANADEMRIKADLALRIQTIITQKKLTQTQAAEKIGISQAKVSELLRGKFRGISEAKMMECLNRLGQDVIIEIKPMQRRKGWGQVAVIGA